MLGSVPEYGSCVPPLSSVYYSLSNSVSPHHEPLCPVVQGEVTGGVVGPELGGEDAGEAQGQAVGQVQQVGGQQLGQVDHTGWGWRRGQGKGGMVEMSGGAGLWARQEQGDWKGPGAGAENPSSLLG